MDTKLFSGNSVPIPDSNDGLTIAFNDLTYQLKGHKASPNDYPSSTNSPSGPYFYPIHGLTGTIEPGKMVLVLGASGAGATTLLKAVSNRLESSCFTQHLKGSGCCSSSSTTSPPPILYNGLDTQGYDSSKYSAGGTTRDHFKYLSPLDQHLNHYTVEETLEFACRCAYPTKTQRDTMSSSEIELFVKNRVNAMISLLDLHHCRHTIVGDHAVRGVSGGQARRVSIGEMLITSPRLLALDSYSDGLDNVVTLKITQALRQYCEEQNTTVIATLKQPNEIILNQFDSVIVLREGCCVYNGPTCDLLGYFRDHLGFPCPNDISTCDFILDVISDPYLTADRLQQRSEILQAHGVRTEDSSTKPNSQSTKVNSVFSLAEMVRLYERSFYADKQRENIYNALQLHRQFKADPKLYRYDPKAPKPFKFQALSPCQQQQQQQQHQQPTQISRQQSPPEDYISLNADKPQSTSLPSSLSQVSLFSSTQSSLSPLGLAPFPISLGSSFWSVFSRQFKLAIRNKALISFRIINVIISSLILGTIFWNIPHDASHIFQRVTVICIMFNQFAVYNMGGLLTSTRYANTIKKQISSGFFPSWYYTLSLYVSGLPQLLFDCSVLSTVLYFGSGFYRGGEYYLLFWFIAILTALNNYAIVQLVCAATTSEALAGALAIPISAVLLLGSGMFVTNHMPLPLVYTVMYTTPYFWSLRALLNIEFSSPTYDFINPQGQRLGDLLLKQLGVDHDQNAWLHCLFYMFVSTVFWIVFHMFMINRRFYHDHIGTQRSSSSSSFPPTSIDNDKSDRVSVEVNNTETKSNDLLPVLTKYLPCTPCTVSFSDLDYYVPIIAQSQHKKSNKKDSASTPLLDDIDEEKSSSTQKQILQKVSGFATPGSFLALCGPSGSGKTTLIEILAQRKTIGKINGSIKMNGHELVSTSTQLANKINVNTIIGFIEQHDWIYANETVHDALEFVLDMKLPEEQHDNNNNPDKLTKKQIKEAIIDEILDVLELTPFANSLIGMNSNGSKTGVSSSEGLSLSQLKKLSIGLELLSNPSVIYLDEATTSLSSTEAFRVLSLCKKIAQKLNRTIIATVHSPSTEMFYLFDSVLLLGMGGVQIYNGPVGLAGRDFVSFYEKSNLVPKLTTKTNPASWMLECLQPHFVDDGNGGEEYHDSINEQNKEDDDNNKGLTIDDLDDELRKYNTHIAELNTYWKGSPECQSSTNTIQQLSQTLKPLTLSKDPNAASTLKEPKPQRNILYQFFRLTWRLFVGTFRDPTLFSIRILMFIFVTTLACALYGKLDITDVSGLVTGIQSKALVVTFAAILFSSQQSAMIDRRAWFLREVERGYYYNIWLFSFYLVECFMATFLTTFLLSPAFFVLNWHSLKALIIDQTTQQIKWDQIFTTTKWLWPWGQFAIGTITNLIFYTSLSIAIISFSPDGRISGIFQGLSALLFYYLNGIIIPMIKLQSPIARWICSHNPTRFITEAVVMGQFEWFDKEKMIDIVINGETTKVRVVDYVKSYLGYDYNHYWMDLLRVGIFSAVFVIIAIVCNRLFWFKQR